MTSEVSARPRSLAKQLCVPALVIAMIQPIASSAQDTTAPGACPDGKISRITIDNGPVFVTEPEDRKVLKWAMGTANLLHVRTSRSFIRKELLFDVGDCFDPFLLTESRRLLDRYGFLSRVQVVPEEDGIRGDKAVRVNTWDEWSTQFDIGVTYEAGLNVEKLQFTEKNFLGHGVRARIAHRERRETRQQSFSLSTPRLFGRTDASIGMGTSRSGSIFNQGISYRFVGELSRVSASESFDTSTDFFSYSTGGSEPYSQVLVPISRERFEIAMGTRVGDPGRSWIFGLSLKRDVRRLDGVPEFVRDEDFGQTEPGLADLPPSVLRQVGARSATRIGLHIGTRRYRYEEYMGLDALRGVQIVPLGYFAGFSVGRSLGMFVPADSPDVADTYVRVHASTGIPISSSVIHGRTTTEVAYAGGAWRDLLTELQLVAYGRASWLPYQTLVLRASAGGGWRTTIPFQMTLGGRGGVRSLSEDRFPGGRRVLFQLEDRIRVGWPNWRASDFGLTVYGDAGRTWKGDAPFGVNSGWQASIGGGVRFGIPSGTRNVTRHEIVFPLGRGGSPIYRVYVEWYGLGNGFGPPKMGRSRRFGRGPESF